MEAFVQRLINERDDLNEKYFLYLKLKSFLSKESISTLTDVELYFLNEQAEIMNKYLNILNLRISLYLNKE